MSAEWPSDIAGTAAADVAVEKKRAEEAEGLLAPKASPTFTGTPTAPTPSGGDSSTKIATTAFVAGVAGADVTAEQTRAEAAEALKLAKASNLSDVASATTARTNLGLGTAATHAVSDFDAAGLAATAEANATTKDNTEKARAEAAEAAAIATAESVAEASAKTTSEAEVAVEKSRAETAEALKAPLASPALTGVPTVPTAAPKTSTTQAASTAFAQKTREEAEAASDPAGTSVAGVKVEKERAEVAEALKAPLASPVLTGTPKTPTAEPKTNTQQVASTAFVQTAKGEEKERAEAAEATKATTGALTAETIGREAADATEKARAEAAEALKVPLTQKGVASGVGTLDAGGYQPLTELSPSVVNSSTAVIDVRRFLSGGVVDFVAAVKAMEEERKALLIPASVTLKEGPVLCNKTNVSGSLATFRYHFIFEGSPTITLPAMAAGQFALRFNETAEGVNVNTALYTHPDIILTGDFHVQGSGVADGGSFMSAYNRTFRVETNYSLENVANGIVSRGFGDHNFIAGVHTINNNVSGWCLQPGEGDGQDIKQIQAYACKGILAKHGSGTAVDVVSGVHQFVVANYLLQKWHLEGDGPNEAGGKPQGPLIIFNGGVYDLEGARLSTLANPSHPAIEVNDGGIAGRFTLLTLKRTQFMQRLDNPANPTGKAEPVGNLQGVAIKFAELSPETIIKLIDTHAEIFQQTSESSQFDTRQIIGMRFTAANAGLQEQLNNRRVMINSGDTEIVYNVSAEVYEIRPIGGEHDQVTTRRFSQPELKLAKYAAGSEGAKAAPTTRTAGTHYYNVWAIDDRGRRTNLSAEKSIAISEGEVPTVQIVTGHPCRVIVQHSTSAGVFTSPAEWAEIILPRGQATLADMGNAIGGQEWTKVGSTSAQTGFTRGSEPTTAASQNNTADGYVTLGLSSYAVSYFTEIPQTGEWQKEGDIAYVNGIPARCIAAATGNNGGTWILLPSNANALAEGESTLSRDVGIRDSITVATKEMRLAYFTAPKTGSRKNIEVCTGTTGAGATPTVVQFAVFEVNLTTGKLTRVAVTANNTALLKTAGETYKQATEAAWTAVAGTRYAVGLLVVTAAATPTLGGISSTLVNTILGQSPRITALVAGLSEIPTEVEPANIKNSSSLFYAATLP